jgi:hypothetical protein
MFSAHELSRFLGRPVHLFAFTRQSLAWRFASGSRDVVVGDTTYQCAPGIARSEISQTSERAKDKITISMPYLLDPNALEHPVTQSFGDNFRPYPPGDVVYVTCMSMHANDDAIETAADWMGRVSSAKFTDTQLELTCEPTRSNKKFSGNTGRWCVGCPLALDGTGNGQCNVDAATHGFAATLLSVEGLKLTADAFAGHENGRLEGGYIEYARADGLIERRTIMSHSASTITINYGGAEIIAELQVTAYPGCAHTTDDCNDYYNNIDNFGGHKDMVVENPMDGHRVAW